jgi:hypothetical protein
MLVPQAVSPLAETITRLNKLSNSLYVAYGVPAEPGWHTTLSLFMPGSEGLGRMIALKQQQLRTTAPNVIGSAVLQAYQWPVMAAAAACYLLDHRVPDLDAENVWLRWTEEMNMDGIAWQNGRFTALVTDAAANHPHVTIVPDQATLCTSWRTQIESHLCPIIEQLCQQLRCHPKGLWLAAADRLVGTLLWLMPLIKPNVTPAEIEQEVEMLIRVPGSPLNNQQVGVFTLTCVGRTKTFLDRVTCCYWYKMEDGDYCTTCPHRAKEERNQRLLLSMAQNG